MAIRGFFQRFLSSAVGLAVVLGLVHLGLPSEIRPAAGAGSFVRGIYGAGATDVVQAAGFNTINVVSPSRSYLDSLVAKGFRAVVWLGEYDRGSACQFEFSDTQVRSIVGAVAGHPGIAAYQLSDEPNYARLRCANAVQQHRDRSALIKSVDPSKPTYLTISTWDGREGYPYQYFAGVADIMGLDVYPCTYSTGCDFGMIETAVRQAAGDGVSRFWAVVQDFADSWYRVPSASELRTQFERWSLSSLEGYFVYHWVYGNIANRPDHLAVLAEAPSLFEGGTGDPAVAPSPTLSPTSAPSPTSSPTPLPSVSPSSSPTPSPIPTTDRYPAGSIVARATFPGNSSGWGSANVGGGWSVITGPTSVFSRWHSRGLVTIPGHGASAAAILGAVAARDIDASVTLRLPDIEGSGNLYAYLLLRRTSSSNIRVGPYVTPDGTVFLRGQDADGAALFGDVPTGLVVDGREALHMRVVVFGSSPTTIRARVWRAHDEEPSSWHVSTTTSLAGIQGPGAVGVRTVNDSNDGEAVTFDDFLVVAL